MRSAHCTGSNSLFVAFRSVLGRSSLFLVTLLGLACLADRAKALLGPGGPQASTMKSIVSSLNGLALELEALLIKVKIFHLRLLNASRLITFLI